MQESSPAQTTARDEARPRGAMGVPSSLQAWLTHGRAPGGALLLAIAVSAPPVRAQGFPEVSIGAGFARQPHDNAGHLARTGAHLQGALRMPIGDRAAARLTLVYEHFGVRSPSFVANCEQVGPEPCSAEPTRLPFALGLVTLAVTGRSESFGERLYGGAGAGLHHAFRSPWLGERTGLVVHAMLGASLGAGARGLGIEASVHHLMSEHTGTPWLVPVGLTWTF